ncbi:hypothetical protein [Proteiniphilum sp. UBA5384]|uniref:hypothetical protein n=1 Tax=Proteiniphilum sp. UBA5384 TaxID=1947279 RepID=UPI0025FAE87A|nr:hypothetical protein [Proteiniphilum sp. UBA5384]
MGRQLFRGGPAVNWGISPRIMASRRRVANAGMVAYTLDSHLTTRFFPARKWMTKSTAMNRAPMIVLKGEANRAVSIFPAASCRSIPANKTPAATIKPSAYPHGCSQIFFINSD